MTAEEKIKRELIAALRKKRERKQQSKQSREHRSKIAVAVMLVLIVSVTLGIVYNASAKEITITEINEFTGLNSSQTIRTRSSNVGEVLEEHGLSIGEDDRLNIPTDRPVSNKDDIIITRGKRVTIKAGGHERSATVTKADLTDALIEAGYIPGEFDNITTDGDTIELVSVSHVEEIIEEKMERGVDYVEDSDIAEGLEAVIDEGEDGINEVHLRVTYLNGEEYERTVISETVTSEPRNKIIATGTRKTTPNPTSSSSGDTGGTINGYRYKKKITMTATAYSTDPSENAGYSVSAMGNPLGYGIVAVDPNVIPLGSTVYVTSPDGSWVYGVASAEDTGGAIKGNKIDLCYPYNNDAFGRRSCVVYILD